MRLFVLNLVVALSWALVTGELTVSSLAVGFAVGFGVLWLLEPVHGDRDYHRRPARLLSFVVWYLLEIILSSLRVARSVLSPVSELRDGWLAVSLETRSDGETALLANLISLTPGTLSVEVSADGRVLFVHALLRGDTDVAALERELSTTLQGRLLRVLGRKEA